MRSDRTTQHEESMKDDILNKIDKDAVSMRPRSYFAARIVLLILTLAATLIVSVFLANFILFSLRISGHGSLLGFGSRGLWTFLEFFPWGLLALDIVLIALLERMIRQFRFGYRSPVLYLLLALCAGTVGFGIAIDRGTDWNDRMMDRADTHNLPSPFRDVYEHARRPMPPGSGLCRCIVSAIGTRTMVVYDPQVGSTTLITVTLPPDVSEVAFSVGDTVFIAGEAHDGTIDAFGVSAFPHGRHH